MTGARPVVVNIYWIMESITAGDPVEEKKFQIVDRNGSLCEFNRSCLSKTLIKEPISFATNQESKFEFKYSVSCKFIMYLFHVIIFSRD